MAVEVRAREPPVPRPVVLGVGRRVNAYVSATSLDVALEIVLLRKVENIARRVEKDDGSIARQILLRERIGVFGGIDGETVFLTEFSDQIGRASCRERV